ncbi:MAG: TetR/AcrR family transcriptional regulator [Chloroflexota bacterium]
MTSREALVDATKELLSTQGYEATSPSQIQSVSGVGQGSFYHHFDGKADLASAALTALAAEMCAQFDKLSDGEGLAVADAYLSHPRDALAGCRIGRITMESSLEDDRIRTPIATYFAHLRARLSEAFGGLDLSIDAAALADLAIAAVQGSYVVARATGDPQAQANATSALHALVHQASERSAP